MLSVPSRSSAGEEPTGRGPLGTKGVSDDGGWERLLYLDGCRAGVSDDLLVYSSCRSMEERIVPPVVAIREGDSFRLLPGLQLLIHLNDDSAGKGLALCRVLE